MLIFPGRIVVALLLVLALSGLTWLFFLQDHRTVLENRPVTTDLEKKIGQLIMIGFNGTHSDDYGVQAIAAQLADGKIGGVMLLSRNIETADQLKRLTAHLHKQAIQTTALIAVDQEGGHVQRLAVLGGRARWMSAKDLAQQTDTCVRDEVEAYYLRHAAILPELGINVNFGPVADLNLNPENPVIGKKKRSFSASPDAVTRCAAGFIAAHKTLGVATALKHFPGHGSTTKDSHRTLPVLDQTWREQELDPYKDLAQQVLADMVMMGHLAHQRFSDAPNVPASMSQKGVKEAREVTSDATVILTDDLEMDAVTDAFSLEEAAVTALAAGNDMILVSSFGRKDPDLGDRLNAAILAAIKDGRLNETQIDRSVERIQALKNKLSVRQKPSS